MVRIDFIKEVLKDSVEFALLFGSMVTGRISPESDIDIGAYFKNPVGFDEYFGIKAALSDKMRQGH
jgi:predicted nucleotidyltransferase